MLRKKSISMALILALYLSFIPLTTQPVLADTGEALLIRSLTIKLDGSLWAWGNNDFGQVGDGTITQRNIPVKIMDGVAAVSHSSHHTLAVKTDGSLWAWGRNNYGQLGDGTRTQRNSPLKIMDGVANVSTGWNYSMAMKTDGSLWVWGRNRYGQLGDGTTIDRLSPVKIMDGVAVVSTSGLHTMAIKTDGSLWAWGSNYSGQIGDGTTIDRLSPIKIMDGVAAVSTSDQHTMAIKTDGSLWAWGNNYSGQIGNGTTSFVHDTPVKIMDGVATVIACYHHTFAIKTDGSLWAWGSNRNGQLGYGATPTSFFDESTNLNSPIKIMDGAASVYDGGSQKFAIKTDGSLWAWGSNESGWLGDGTTIDRPSPVKIMDEVVDVFAYEFHTMAIKANGSLWTWGLNAFGQLGDGTTTNRLRPTEVTIWGTVPSVPTNVSATPGDKSVTLNWAAPTSNGGVAITRYEVQINNLAWVNVGTRINHTFTNLINGTRYTFRVRAVNSAGPGTVASVTAAPYDLSQQFVSRLLTTVLDRTSYAQSGHEFWTNELRSGNRTGADLAHNFFFGQEFINSNVSNRVFVERLTRALMGREPNPAGVAHWAGRLDAGWPREDVFKDFVHSAEFDRLSSAAGIERGTYRPPQDIQIRTFVIQLFMATLERTPNPDGLNFFVNAVTNGRPGASLAYDFVFSAEMERRNLSDEHFIEVLCNALMGRPASPSGVAFWVNRMNTVHSGSRHSIFYEFIDSEEFRRICAEYGIAHR